MINILHHVLVAAFQDEELMHQAHILLAGKYRMLSPIRGLGFSRAVGCLPTSCRPLLVTTADGTGLVDEDAALLGLGIGLAHPPAPRGFRLYE